jgi:hypothetical protein
MHVSFEGLEVNTPNLTVSLRFSRIFRVSDHAVRQIQGAANRAGEGYTRQIQIE